jgi:hypothetical protein
MFLNKESEKGAKRAGVEINTGILAPKMLPAIGLNLSPKITK